MARNIQVELMKKMHGELLEAVRTYTDRYKGMNPVPTAIDGFLFLRSDVETRPNHLIYRPSLCVTLQGSKCIHVGSQWLDYEAGKALVVSVKMPASGRIVHASAREPYLGLIIEFDMAMMREVLEHVDAPALSSGDGGKGMLVTDFSKPLADCALRMIRLLDTPRAIPVLVPSIMREICYWLLTGPEGGEIYRVACSSGYTHGIVDSVYALRDRYAEPIRVEDLAHTAKMSPSAFHKRFKSLTGTTPVQYQKQIRLLEARRLLLSSEINVETAAMRVGYESASQFSREYARMFGNPPRRDASSLVLG